MGVKGNSHHGYNLKFYFEVAMCVLHDVSNNQLRFVDAQ